MTDNLQGTQNAVQTPVAEQPIAVEPAVDEMVALQAQEDKAEAYLKENQSILRCMFMKIPGPIRAVVKCVLKVLLLPLRFLAILPFRGLYAFLNDFVNKG